MKVLQAALMFTLAVAGGIARADLVEIVWSGDGTQTLQREFAPGKFIELCGRLPAGATIRWSFEASGPTDFNIHYHQGREVVYPAQLAGVASAKDALVVRVDQDYCWMWTNGTARSLVLKATLAR